MEELYSKIIDALEALGYATKLRADPIERVICASRRDGDSLRGNSFWITHKSGSWFLVTWAPVYYRFPDEATLLRACIDFLQQADRTHSRLPQDAIAKYKTKEISEELFEQDDF